MASAEGRWRIPLAAHLGILDATSFQFAGLAGRDLADNLACIADQGFSGVSDNAHLARDPADRRIVARECRRRGLHFTSLTFHTPTEPPGEWSAAEFVEERRVIRACEAARALGATAITIVVMDSGAPFDMQRAHIVQNLRRAADIAVEFSATLSVEAVSAVRLPGVLVERVPMAVDIARDVAHEGLGVTVDTCHAALAGDDVAGVLRGAMPSIRAVQVADVPGRVEPGAGRLDWHSVTAALRDTGWTGVVEAEFFASGGDSASSERRVLDALDRVWGW